MSLEKVERCPVCDGQSFRPYLECRDHSTTNELFHVEQCTSCGLLLTNPRPIQAASPAYYQSEQYISHQSQAKGLFDRIYMIIRRFTLKWKLSLVRPYLHNPSLLDFGCGTGAFLKYCSDSGIKAVGVEPSEKARDEARANGLQVWESLPSVPEQQFDVITLWHVLEHLYEIQGTLQSLKDRLSDHGIIFIAVPNHESFDAQEYQSMWAAYDVPRHLWHFSKGNIIELLHKNGFRLKKTIPMKLDAYYVSLLSEKYLSHGSFTLSGVLRGVLRAFQSNSKGAHLNNQSSLIYIAQK